MNLTIMLWLDFLSILDFNLMGSMIKRHTPAIEPMTTPQISPFDKDESIKDNKTIEAMKMFDIVKLKQAK